MIHPPHATHSLQALNVVMFKSLSSHYLTRLISFTQKSMGLLPVGKADFILLFWAAWTSSFTPNLIFKAFEATGVWPRNRDAVLKRFRNRVLKNSDESAPFTSLMESDWRRLRQVVQSVVKDGAEKEANELTEVLHHYQVQGDLLIDENQDLRESLAIKKKCNKHGKKLDMHRESEYYGGAEWWSPRSFKHAGERQAQREQEEEEENLRKADMKKLKASNALLNKKLQEERRIERERLKKEREKEEEKKAQERAQKKQQKEQEKQAANTSNSVQQSQRGNRTASKKAVPERKRGEGCTAGGSRVVGEELSQARPPKITRRGRNIIIPRNSDSTN
jgi:hypothetical protein